MFRNLRIGARLAISFGVVLLLAVLAIAVGLQQVASVAERNELLLKDPLTKERITSDWYRVIDAGSRRTLAMAVSADPVLEETFRDDLKAASALSTQYQQQLTALATSDDEKRLLADIAAARTTYLNLRNEIATLRREGKGDQAGAFVERLKPATKGYLSTLQAMLDHERAAIDKQAAEIKATVSRSLWALGALGVAIVLLDGCFSGLIAIGITRPIRSAIHAAQRIAGGDVESPVAVDRRDELGQLQQAMRHMAEQLRQMIHAIRDSAGVIASASTEIASGNTDLSQRTEEQSSSLQRTASSIEELSSAVRNNADSSRQAQQLVAGATTSARQGDQVVKDVVGTMQAITASSKRIGDIIAVIDGIAFQTNILALNAAVEAARAGEQGRGFAVVAGEVRTLAQRSSTAAKEIRSLILDSVEKVDSGARLVTQAGDAMHEILGSIEQVDAIIGHIAIASEQQAGGIAHVNQAVAALDGTTQQNSALVQQSAAAALSLQEQAQRLVKSVAVFERAGR